MADRGLREAFGEPARNLPRTEHFGITAYVSIGAVLEPRSVVFARARTESCTICSYSRSSQGRNSDGYFTTSSSGTNFNN